MAASLFFWIMAMTSPAQFSAVLHVPILPPLRVSLRKTYASNVEGGHVRMGCAFLASGRGFTSRPFGFGCSAVSPNPLRPEELYVNVRPESHVVSQIPAHVVRVLVNHDVDLNPTASHCSSRNHTAPR